ncbi:MAG: type 1 glutamine amidotransferase [Pseudomonadales bacterium]|nr:type 1 glutamine amidotransferase [Pseudomonadales bacterium]MBO6597153.1 type 1 glutamine amidotransferase [Pseudomonadales bacterium]MBO6655340.1 type 1 glutamine amidotransferase [Pseudomonadales bacterium]MBO6703784.1 type 1 glutamine amidotransferase [Pseudomonadales bacterium]MBO6823660.1 type 1 glutamine amidotransferase [Pseudomonadales bacterium]
MTISVGVIETGESPEHLVADFGTYPDMGRDLLKRCLDEVECTTISPVRGQTLPDPCAFDAYMIMGSEFSANDRFEWIGDLKVFVNQLAAKHIPVIGICFGHQLIAKAMGGQIARTDWVVGRRRYTRPGADPIQAFDTLCFHQDQVTVLPRSARVILTSDECTFAGLEYPSWPCWTIQSHPEFLETYTRRLIKHSMGHYIGADLANQALSSLATYREELRFVRSSVRQTLLTG